MAALWLTLALLGQVEAQMPDRIYRLGILATEEAAIETWRAATLPELARLGFSERRNIFLDAGTSRPGGARLGARPLLTTAHQLVAAKPDVLIGVGTLAIAALQDATATVPIVMSLGPDDLAAHGFGTSLARPIGNITGVIAMSAELDGKRFQLLKETIPKVRRIAAILAPDVQVNLNTMRNIAAEFDFELVDARSVYSRDEYPAQFAALRRAGAEALMIGSAPLFSHDPVDLVRLAIAAGMPTICEWRGLVESGCLIGYGPSLSELRRRTAHYVAHLLRGASPSELPIEGPTHFEFVINLKTAHALGITIPPTLLARADEVIE
jgi:putative tryptophan/tyrosine transport system substrate-binding protein